MKNLVVEDLKENLVEDVVSYLNENEIFNYYVLEENDNKVYIYYDDVSEGIIVIEVINEDEYYICVYEGYNDLKEVKELEDKVKNEEIYSENIICWCDINEFLNDFMI